MSEEIEGSGIWCLDCDFIYLCERTKKCIFRSSTEKQKEIKKLIVEIYDNMSEIKESAEDL